MSITITLIESGPASYCAVCDHYYLKGKFWAHKTTSAHTASLNQRRSMAIWYKGNGK